jgi:hypothetical protein
VNAHHDRVITVAPVAEQTERRLLVFITSCLAPADWRRAEALAIDAKRLAADVTTTSSPRTDQDSGLPVQLAAAARRVVREYLSPVRALDVFTRIQPTRPALALVPSPARELRDVDLVLLSNGLVDVPAVPVAA